MCVAGDRGVDAGLIDELTRNHKGHHEPDCPQYEGPDHQADYALDDSARYFV